MQYSKVDFHNNIPNLTSYTALLIMLACIHQGYNVSKINVDTCIILKGSVSVFKVCWENKRIYFLEFRSFFFVIALPSFLKGMVGGEGRVVTSNSFFVFGFLIIN